MRFEGIYTPVVTPHDPDFSISKDKFAEVIEFLIDKGVNGLIVAGRRANTTPSRRKSGWR